MDIEPKNIFRLTGLKVGLLVTLLSLGIYAVKVPFFQLIELKAYDLHFLSRGAVEPGPEVVIAAIDEKSLDELGRWPWPRARMAELIDSLADYGAAVVAFDVIFAEPDDSSGLSAIRGLRERLRGKDAATEKLLRKMESEADNDRILSHAVAANEAVTLGYFFFTDAADLEHLAGKENGGEDGGAPSIASSRFALERSIDGSDIEPPVFRAAAFEGNLESISSKAKSFGFFNVIPDQDGSIRWVPLVFRYNGALYPHLSLEAVRRYAGSPPLMLNFAQYGVDSILVGREKVSVSERGRVLINFRGPARSFPHYSFSDIVKKRLPDEALRDRIVLVGATATGIYDVRVTPFGSVFPGVEINANVIDNMLAGDFIYRPDWVAIFDILAIVVLGLILSILIPRVKAVYTLVVSCVLIFMYILVNNYVFESMNVWVSFVYPTLTIVVVSASVTVVQYMTEEKEKKEIRDAFSHYVSPSLVDEITKRPDLLELGGEEKRLTVFFSDIRGFTSVSEGLSPKALVKLMNDYLTPMTDIVIKNQGTIDKYMGDAIMAFWGAPMDDPDHAKKACQTALDMMEELPKLHDIWEVHGIKNFEIGIGLSTGIITVGNMGSLLRFDYTVIGDSINLGSRLEGLTKEYGTKIIVTKYTYEDVKEDFTLRELDMVKVKGKERHIKIYELVGRKEVGEKTRTLVKTFEMGLASYRTQDWNGAEMCFRECLKIRPDDGPARVFLGRVERLRTIELPEDWDGIYVMTSK